jgi:hypothetical protein
MQKKKGRVRAPIFPPCLVHFKWLLEVFCSRTLQARLKHAQCSQSRQLRSVCSLLLCQCFLRNIALGLQFNKSVALVLCGP